MTFNPTIRKERAYASFAITNDLKFLKKQMLTWASPFNICCFLDSHEYPGQALSPTTFECLLAAGSVDTFSAGAGAAFSSLRTWALERQDWLFGHFNYDLAAETEPGPPDVTENRLPQDPIGFPDLFFFVPETIIQLQKNEIRIGTFRPDPAAVWQEICSTVPPEPSPLPQIIFTPRFTEEEYLAAIRALQRHILRGDCYEINFCQEFFARPLARLDPYAVWQALSNASPNPFAAFYRIGPRFLFCASPERYLRKTGNTLLSQPIKGTAPRLHDDPDGDSLRGRSLYQSPKDRAENVMVVDLVRNDLARVCRPGSVKVPELYGVYPFPHVHQMISSVTGGLQPGIHWTEAIRASFPMGSMTGAPKNSVVRLISQYERSRRGIYSGTVGYVTPTGDFDFNVVIRSLTYQQETAYLSYQVGSGITYYSDPAAEYQECLIKAQGIKKALGSA